MEWSFRFFITSGSTSNPCQNCHSQWEHLRPVTTFFFLHRYCRYDLTPFPEYTQFRFEQKHALYQQVSPLFWCSHSTHQCMDHWELQQLPGSKQDYLAHEIWNESENTGPPRSNIEMVAAKRYFSTQIRLLRPWMHQPRSIPCCLHGTQCSWYRAQLRPTPKTWFWPSSHIARLECERCHAFF